MDSSTTPADSVAASDTFLFTSESVGEGHPDKMCDRISDAILDACLKEDPDSKVACETATKTDKIFLLGEITTDATFDYKQVVQNCIKEIGYDSSDNGFDYRTCNVEVEIGGQSEDIAHGVHKNKTKEEIGAGDQGMMFGYATDETEELMPLSIMLAHKLNKRMADLRRSGELPWARPDSKSQVTVEYKKDNGRMIPLRVHTIVISIQHSPDVSTKQMEADLKTKVIQAVVPERYLSGDVTYHLQPSGNFVLGGPQADAGLTGRKIIVDTYGGWGAHGGGCFSGKDVTKVDRSGAYAARWIAKSLVAAGLCKRVLIQVAYAIGVAKPVSLYIDTYGTGARSDAELLDIVEKNFDLRPGKIIEELQLRQPMYEKTACYGHFGRTEFPWEQPKQLRY